MSDTKKCKYCKTEIDKGAKICPNCKKKQKGKGGLIAIIVIVLIIGAAAGAGKNKKSNIDNSNATDKAETIISNTSSESSKDTKEKTETSTVEEPPKDDAVLVGGSFEDKGLKFTVNDATIDYQFEDKYDMYKLEDGFVYLLVDFTFENTGDGDKYVSIYDFKCYADNSACEQEYVTSETGDFINTNLSSGRNISFKTLYAVPADAESIELEYEADVWSDEKVLVKIK